MKLCKTCKKKKPFTDFYKHKKTQDKLWPECKSCSIDRAIRWGKNNIEKKRRNVRRDWRKHRKRRLEGLKRSWNKRDFNNLRDKVLERDNYSCVVCGLTRDEHFSKWNVDINVDHINRNRKDNTMENLQTLCLVCHGSKSGKDALGVKKKLCTNL